MAKRSSKLLAVFLLLGLAAVSLLRQETSLMHAQTIAAAACNHHGTKAPTRTPSNYRCCQLGHNSAVLQSWLPWQPSLIVVADDSGSAPSVFSGQNNSGNAAASSPDPPHNIPLRL